MNAESAARLSEAVRARVRAGGCVISWHVPQVYEMRRDVRREGGTYYERLSPTKQTFGGSPQITEARLIKA
jgi:hypothetical protein